MVKREERKKQITEERQQQLLNAAIEVFSSKGYAAATVPEIARLAEVSVGTIYNYYPGKRELFIASIRNLIITTPLKGYIETIPQADMTDIFKNIMRDRFNLMNGGIATRIPSLIGEVQRDPELKAIWAEQFIHPFMSGMEKMYTGMMSEGKVRKMNPAIVTRAIGGLILGFLMLRIMEGEKSPVTKIEQDDVVETVAAIIVQGIAGNTGKQ